MAGLLGAIRLDKQRLADAAAGGAAWATDVAEALVRSGVPFRVAHEKTGALVVETERSGGTPSPAALQALGINVKLDPVASVEARSSHGGPAPERVAEQTAELRSAIARLRS
jgi:argininosuccinate lyase